MFYYPRFAGIFEDPFVTRRRKRRRDLFDIDLFDDDPFMGISSSDDEDEFYQPFFSRRRMVAPPRRRERERKVQKEEKKQKERISKKKKIDPLSLFFRDFGNVHPLWMNEFYDGEKKNKDEKEDVDKTKEKEDTKERKNEPISYKRIKTFSSVNGRTESKEVVEDSRSGTKKEIHSKLIGDKMLTVVKKTTKEGKEEVLKKCEGIKSEEEFLKLWKANEQETKAISEKKEQKQ